MKVLPKVTLNLRETFLIEFSGGPYDTMRQEAPGILDWPLPNIIFAQTKRRHIITDGYYEKTWESEGEAKHSEEARGAIYKWREDEDE